MNPFDLLNRLNVAGVSLSVSGGKLAWHAPRGAVTPDLLDAMKDSKPILLAIVHDSELRAELEYQFNERAGICEFDGGMSRSEAEKTATDEILAEIRRLDEQSSHKQAAYVDSDTRSGDRMTQNPSDAPKRARNDLNGHSGDSAELEPMEKQAAKERRTANLKQGTSQPARQEKFSEREKGDSRDKVAAKERQAEHGNTAPGKPKNTSENFSQVKGKASAKVASAVGMSSPTLYASDQYGLPDAGKRGAP